MTEHIVKSYDDELSQLAAEVVRMGGLAEAQLDSCIEAVAKRDLAEAEAVVARDEQIDAMEIDIDGHCTRLIALRQPVAIDLRRILAAIRIIGNLERCGDMAETIAASVRHLTESELLIPHTGTIERMGRLVTSRLREALNAYATNDVERAVAIWSSDNEVDEYYNSIFRELLTYMMGDPRMINACSRLLFVAKSLERVGDHATNIAEVVYYQVMGRPLPQSRPKGAAA
ncbi:MAG: phosphate signaling complex protein PhoU [Alphaproteobacteria bacterium]